MIYNLLDATSMLLNIHNIFSALLILIALISVKSQNVLYAVVCYLIVFILTSLFGFEKDVLPSFFYFGLTALEVKQENSNVFV